MGRGPTLGLGSRGCGARTREGCAYPSSQSVQKIAGLSFERAFFGHGSPLDSGASATIAQLAATLQ